MTDDELKSVLDKWPAPLPAVDLRERIEAALERARQPWWKRVLGARIAIPVPVAAAALAGLAAVMIWLPRSVEPPRVVLRTSAVDVPVIRERVVTKTIYVRARPAGTAERMAVLFGGFEPVRDMKPEILRRSHER